MSEMKRDVDLTRLARAPDATAAGLPPKKKRRLALVVPLLLVLGFVAVLSTTLGDLWRGKVRVTVVRPVSADAAATTAGATELQRSGWVEPDPYPLLAPALAPGIVREVLVLESDAVEKEQPIARLVDDETKVALAQVEAGLLRARGDAQKAKAERDLAQQSFDAALEVTESEAVAAADLAGRAAEAEHRAAAAVAARAAVRIAEEELAVQEFLAENGGAGPRQVELARARVDAERATLATMEADARLAAAEAEKAKAMLARAARERELRLTDRRELEVANAEFVSAEAAVAEAEAARDAAKLRLDRMTVRAPAAGVVMQRLAGPGAQVGGPGDPALVALFDPKSLRVRVDVEQSEVARIAVGQQAQVKSPMRPGKLYDGEVFRLVHFADIQKVTLQVHVRVRDADEALRPEMLVEVRFLAKSPAEGESPKQGAGAGRSFEPGAVWIPQNLIVAGAGGPSVWVVDALSGRAASRRLEVAGEEGGRALVRSGLNVSDKVIDGGRGEVREGSRVEVSGVENEGH